ncbi:MAG TPA: hypothetical protein PK393_07860 [Synergistaceae bacterium]|nr:hypothetical protein [Synergistaceae bacterium]
MVRDLTWDVVGKDLQGLARRFGVVAENMANGNTPDTPGKRFLLRISFER